MTVVALVFFPVVLVYLTWTYVVFRRRITGPRLGTPAEGDLSSPTSPTAVES